MVFLASGGAGALAFFRVELLSGRLRLVLHGVRDGLAHLNAYLQVLRTCQHGVDVAVTRLLLKPRCFDPLLVGVVLVNCINMDQFLLAADFLKLLRVLILILGPISVLINRRQMITNTNLVNRTFNISIVCALIGRLIAVFLHILFEVILCCNRFVKLL